MAWPNFFVIGAAKSGTTSLYHYLEQHPQIYMSSLKEPNFFAFYGKPLNRSTVRFIVNLDDYLALFKGVKDENAIGEASTTYLASPQAAAGIHRFIPHAKLIAILRNPIDRAYSEFLMELRDYNAFASDFLQAIEREDIHDDNSRPCHLRNGFYDTHLQYFLKFFSARQLRVFLFEDLQNPIPMLQEIFRFLEVDEAFQPEVAVRYNTSIELPRNPLGRFIIKATPVSVRHKLNCVLPPPVFRWYMSHRQGHFKESQCPPEAREKLRPIFRDHILRLQDMIQRDLSAWLT